MLQDKDAKMNIEKLIMISAIACIGVYALYLGKIEIVTAALGVFGGLLTVTGKGEAK